MNNLVQIKNGKLATTSRVIANAFGKTHQHVIDAIKNLECSENFSLTNFRESDFTNERGRTYQEFIVSEDGAMRLIMGFTGKKASQAKEQFIYAFREMQRKLSAKQDGIEWKTARLQGKAARSVLTDTLADFVAYAKAQGSQNADRYYGSITLMEYKALALIEKGAKVGTSFRDTLDGMQIAHLTVAENLARKTITKCMAEKMHYKDIYQTAKLEIEKLAEIVGVVQFQIK